jgi:hypothetical protein
MLGWNIHIKRGDETIQYAESKDLGLDRKIRDRAAEILDSADYPEWGYGYPNRYLIRNDQFPEAEIYRHTDRTVPGDTSYRVTREDFVLGPFADIPGDELLWVELWDLS